MSIRTMVANGLAWAWRVVSNEPEPVLEDVMVKHLRVDGDRAEIALSHSIVKELAAHLATWHEAFAGPNYAAMSMVAKDGAKYEVSVSKGDRTPHVVAQEAKELLADVVRPLRDHGDGGRADKVEAWLSANSVVDSGGAA